MFQKVLSYVNQHGMLLQGDKVVAGVSGGVDSVCLLFVLQKMLENLGGSLYVAHVNHGLRGEEADRDEEFVRRLCVQRQIPFYAEKVSLREIARERKMTEEEAGRAVRYAFFRQVVKETGASKIAVGHNANDNAETLLFHLIRGSGIKGLGGILPVQGEVIRPLLCVKREEIEKFAEENGLDFCMDKTNLEDTYTRNRIRHKLLPIMEEINPGAVEAIGRAAGACAEAGRFLETEGKEAFAEFAECEKAGRRVKIRKEAFEKLSLVVVKELLLEAFPAVSGSRKDMERVHMEGLLALQKKGTGKYMNLPGNVQAENQYGDLLLYKKEKNMQVPEKALPFQQEMKAEMVEWTLPGGSEEGKILLPDGACIWYIIENYEKNMKIPKNRYTKWLDCDIIKNTLHFRTRRSGDWIQVLAEGGRKKLKEYLVNEKIPRGERDSLMLLAEGDEILWVPGYRLSEKVKVKENTKRVLKLTYIGGSGDGAEE